MADSFLNTISFYYILVNKKQRPSHKLYTVKRIVRSGPFKTVNLHKNKFHLVPLCELRVYTLAEDSSDQ